MSDTFLLGAGFSKAICETMPVMGELFTRLEGLIGTADGFSREAYEYAAGNVETLLSYYAIPSPHDHPIETLRKQRVTALLEIGIGVTLRDLESRAVERGLNPRGYKLVSKWHEQRSHVLTTNYDTLVEKLAEGPLHSSSSGPPVQLHYTDLYPIPISAAISRDGMALVGSNNPDTFTLYKLHGSTTWYKAQSESTFDPIYGLTLQDLADPINRKFVGDKRRFIVPPVYDKSSLLNHESIRSLWLQANQIALRTADNLYVIGYSLPDTDSAMNILLWEGTRSNTNEVAPRKSLYVIDVDKGVGHRYRDKPGRYYDVDDTYSGTPDAFDKFVDEYADY